MWCGIGRKWSLFHVKHKNHKGERTVKNRYRCGNPCRCSGGYSVQHSVLFFCIHAINFRIGVLNYRKRLLQWCKGQASLYFLFFLYYHLNSIFLMFRRICRKPLAWIRAGIGWFYCKKKVSCLRKLLFWRPGCMCYGCFCFILWESYVLRWLSFLARWSCWIIFWWCWSRRYLVWWWRIAFG